MGLGAVAVAGENVGAATAIVDIALSSHAPIQHELLHGDVVALR